MQKTILIVPCYNEQYRLELPAFAAWRPDQSIRVLFMDDGSTDTTATLLREFCSKQPDGAFMVRSLERNCGKAEAVRRGMLAAIQMGAQITGYLDADLATPLSEASRLIHFLQTSDQIDYVMGSRIKILGHSITRRPTRHYLGRIFATLTSSILKISVYDTQCGAKVFRVDTPLKNSLTTPFHSRWIFDVELIDRLLTFADHSRDHAVRKFAEVPLKAWKDVSGSKLKISNMISALMELVWIALHRPSRTSHFIKGES